MRRRKWKEEILKKRKYVVIQKKKVEPLKEIREERELVQEIKPLEFVGFEGF